jgi:hypothetical protein
VLLAGAVVGTEEETLGHKDVPVAAVALLTLGLVE